MNGKFKTEEFSYTDGRNYIEVKSHGVEGVGLKIEYDEKSEIRFWEKEEWMEFNKRVLELFEQE